MTMLFIDIGLYVLLAAGVAVTCYCVRIIVNTPIALTNVAEPRDETVRAVILAESLVGDSQGVAFSVAQQEFSLRLKRGMYSCLVAMLVTWAVMLGAIGCLGWLAWWRATALALVPLIFAALACRNMRARRREYITLLQAAHVL